MWQCFSYGKQILPHTLFLYKLNIVWSLVSIKHTFPIRMVLDTSHCQTDVKTPQTHFLATYLLNQSLELRACKRKFMLFCLTFLSLNNFNYESLKHKNQQKVSLLNVKDSVY